MPSEQRIWCDGSTDNEGRIAWATATFLGGTMRYEYAAMAVRQADSRAAELAAIACGLSMVPAARWRSVVLVSDSVPALESLRNEQRPPGFPGLHWQIIMQAKAAGAQFVHERRRSCRELAEVDRLAHAAVKDLDLAAHVAVRLHLANVARRLYGDAVARRVLEAMDSLPPGETGPGVLEEPLDLSCRPWQINRPPGRVLVEHDPERGRNVLREVDGRFRIGSLSRIARAAEALAPLEEGTWMVPTRDGADWRLRAPASGAAPASASAGAEPGREPEPARAPEPKPG